MSDVSVMSDMIDCPQCGLPCQKDTYYIEGEERVISFAQELNLQGGQYLLSLGCTRFEHDEFLVYHRLYDICSMTVISDKNTVGFFDMKSKVELD